jgi:hypothetical protein
MNLVLNRKIGPVKQHGIGHIDVNDSHDGYFLTLALSAPSKGSVILNE